jgi:hypothetical protein
MPTKRKIHRRISTRTFRTGSTVERREFNGIRDLAASLHSLHQQMVAHQAPTVQSLIHGRSRDPQVIEQTLDSLLSCACLPEGLALFKSLCRYYFFLNPTATAEYVHTYRDLWDNELGKNRDTTKKTKA